MPADAGACQWRTRLRGISPRSSNFPGCGATCVGRFVEDTRLLGERTPEQWQQDAFGQVDALLRALGLSA